MKCAMKLNGFSPYKDALILVSTCWDLRKIATSYGWELFFTYVQRVEAIRLTPTLRSAPARVRSYCRIWACSTFWIGDFRTPSNSLHSDGSTTPQPEPLLQRSASAPEGDFYRRSQGYEAVFRRYPPLYGPGIQMTPVRPDPPVSVGGSTKSSPASERSIPGAYNSRT